MAKAKKRQQPHYRTHDGTRGMDYQPQTPPGSTRLEMQNRGPFRPGKTQQDYMPVSARPRVQAAQARLAKVTRHAPDRRWRQERLAA